VDGVKSTTGRNSAGAFNGTLALDDIAYGHEQMTNNGFQPDTLVIHPSAWRVLATESLQNLFGLQRGATWNGDKNPAQLGSNTAREASAVTSRFPTDWNIVVSPYVKYNPIDATDNPYWPVTDILICDSNAMGVILASGSGIETEEWSVPERDIRKVKFREYYGICITNDGQGIGVLKNVAIGRSVDFWDAAVHAVTASDALALDVNYTGVAITGQA